MDERDMADLEIDGWVRDEYDKIDKHFAGLTNEQLEKNLIRAGVQICTAPELNFIDEVGEMTKKVEITQRELDGLLAKVEELAGRLGPIREVYEQHKYLNGYAFDQYDAAKFLWLAIRKAVEGTE